MFEKMYLMVLCLMNLQRAKPKCTLSPTIHFCEPLPIMIRNGKLLEPNDDFGNAIIDQGEVLTLSCEGGGGYLLHPGATREVDAAFVTCEGGTIFFNSYWLSGHAHFEHFTCMYPPKFTAFRTNRTCYEDFQIIQVGYVVKNVFYPAYETCFDNKDLRTIYANYRLRAFNNFFQTGISTPSFISDDVFESVPIEYAMSFKGQTKAVEAAVGELAKTYVTPIEYLAIGRLVAKTDFVYAYGERATSHYVNAASQWRGFNGGNWNTLESDLRAHVHESKYDVLIYTGTYGVTQLRDAYNMLVDIYLYRDTKGNLLVPVPLYFYKVIYEKSTKRGSVFIGINNPYYTMLEARSLFFCKDICRGTLNFHWLTWHPNNPHDGYAFCCTIESFREVVKHLPNFEVTGILP